ncbi:MAG: glycosyltransferase [Candidatus Omnitrophota bacterium]
MIRKISLKTITMFLIQAHLCLNFAWAGNFSAQSTLSPQITIANIGNTFGKVYNQVAQNEQLLIGTDHSAINETFRLNVKDQENYFKSEFESKKSLLQFLRDNSYLNKEIFPKIKTVVTDMDGTIAGGTLEADQDAIELLIRLLDVVDRVYIVSVNELQSVEKKIISKIPAEKRRKISVFSSRGIVLTEFDKKGNEVSKTKTLGESHHKNYFLTKAQMAQIEKAVNKVAKEYDQYVKNGGPIHDRTWRQRYPGFYEGYYIDIAGKNIEDKAKFYKRNKNGEVVSIRRMIKENGIGYADMVIGHIPSKKYALNGIDDERLDFIKRVKENISEDVLQQIDLYPEFSAAIGVRRKGAGKSIALKHILREFNPEEVIYFGDEFFEGGMDREIAEQFSVTTVAVDKEQYKIHPKTWGSVGSVVNVDATRQWLRALLENKVKIDIENLKKENYFLSVFIDPNLMESVIKIIPMLRKYAYEFKKEKGRVLNRKEFADFVQWDENILANAHNRKIQQIPDLLILSGIDVDEDSKKGIAKAKRIFYKLMNASNDIDKIIKNDLRVLKDRREVAIALKWMANAAELNESAYSSQRNKARYILEKFSEIFFTDFEGEKVLDAFAQMAMRKILEKIRQGIKPEEILVVPILTSGEQIGQYVGNRVKRELNVDYQPLLFTTAMTYAFGRVGDEQVPRQGKIFSEEGKKNALRYLQQEGILRKGLKHIQFIDPGMTGSFGKLLDSVLSKVNITSELLLIDHADYEKAKVEKMWAHGLNDEPAWKNREDNLFWMTIMLDQLFEHSLESPSHIIKGISQDDELIEVARRKTNHPWFYNRVNQTFKDLMTKDGTGKATKNNFVNIIDEFRKENPGMPPINAGKIKMSPTEKEGNEYLIAINEILKESGKDTVDLELLQEAAKKVLSGRQSEIKGKMGLLAGTFNPLTYGHITASLAGMISEGLEGVVISNNGDIVPSDFFIPSTQIRNQMARIAIDSDPGLIDKIFVSDILDAVVKMFERDDALNLLGNNEHKIRVNADMAAFVWLFYANPNIEWTFIIGSDKVDSYGEKGEENVLRMFDDNNIKVLYFERDGQKINVKEKIKPYEFLENYFEKGLFQKSKVNAFPAVSSTRVRTALYKQAGAIGNIDLKEIIPAKLVDFISHQDQEMLRIIYYLDILDREISRFLNNDDYYNAVLSYREQLRWFNKLDEKKVGKKLYDNFRKKLLKPEGNKLGTIKNQKTIGWILDRVEKVQGITLSPEVIKKAIALLCNNYANELTVKFDEYYHGLDENERRQLYLIAREAGIFHNGTFDREGFPIDIEVDKEASEKMEAARKIFISKLKSLKELSRNYWEKELPRYKGDVTVFNSDKLVAKPKVSIAIVSIFGRRYESLLKRLEEINRMQEKGKIELVITIADPEHITQDKWQGLVEKIQTLGYKVSVVLTKKNIISTNRNLAASISSGDYQVFIDDDVSLHGPVIQKMVQALEKYPELGMVSVPAYNSKLELYKPRFQMKQFVGEKVLVSNLVLGMVTCTRRDIVEVNPFFSLLGNLGDDIHYVRQMHMLGFLGGYVLDNDIYVIDEELGESATKGQISLRPYLIEEGLSYFLNSFDYSEFEHRRAGFKIHTFSKSKISVEDSIRFWRYFSKELIKFLNSDEGSFELQWNLFDFEDEIREHIQSAIEHFTEKKNDITSFKKNIYEPKKLSDVNTFFGKLKYSRLISEGEPSFVAPLEGRENSQYQKYQIVKEIESLLSELSQLQEETKLLYDKHVVAEIDKESFEERGKRLYRAYTILMRLKKIEKKGISDLKLSALVEKAILNAKRASKESFLYLTEEDNLLSVVPFNQMNRFGESDLDQRHHHIGLHPMAYITDGLSISEVQNPPNHNQNDHYHDAPEMTIALSGKIHAVEVNKDGERTIEVPPGNIIQVPANKMHRIANPNEYPTADFTVKNPFISLRKGVDIKGADSENSIVVIPPRKIEKMSDNRGRILTHFYLDMPDKVFIDEDNKLVLDDLNDPIIMNRSDVKVRLVYLNPGKESDNFDINPVYDNFLPVRVFPWTEELNQDWNMEEDSKKITGKVELFDEDGISLSQSNFHGGDLVIIRGSTKDDGIVSGFKIRNTSKDKILVFAIIERMLNSDTPNSNNRKDQTLASDSFSIEKISILVESSI